ncbi:response regulator transcription factor [Paenactinomyces guangxiensis]|uniref:Response regulator transcription factor n=1 Tax=Paenactinomyces guangxiensis TaxID=1490290 RepID=A0A7W1WPH8_9BACL|nr:response regulator transcription factor [Paenactinomyces guangxiensis]MBA4493660.1 response regulator transcription factor [Paenactinomyces guangxiensis]MBH8590947.1 response regulator transcription factor [Paenactinomyces guangxiensis]
MSYTIYMIEDEQKIAESVGSFLRQYGYQVDLVKDFTKVEEEFVQLQPHLVILDVNLPYVDGFYLCRRFRRISSVPILFLSARGTEIEQVLGMESGGDDYMTKPFHLEVLLAKVKALLRRAYGKYAQEELSPERVVQTGELKLYIDKMELVYKDEIQPLTKNEWKLLHLLMQRAGDVVTREECLEVLWDDSHFVDDNTLTVNVTRVRKKLGHWGLSSMIETKRGVGYILNPVEGEKKSI